nr:immunoglobulin heavy chain junction region [Homo sapiens]
CARLGYDYW